MHFEEQIKYNYGSLNRILTKKKTKVNRNPLQYIVYQNFRYLQIVLTSKSIFLGHLKDLELLIHAFLVFFEIFLIGP